MSTLLANDRNKTIMTDDIAPYLLHAHSRTLLRVRLSLIVKEEPSPDFRELLQLRLPLGDNALDLLVIRRFHSLLCRNF